MSLRRALLNLTIRVPPPIGPWLIGAVIGRRPVYQGREEIGDARTEIIETCRNLTPSQRVAFMPALLEEAFGPGARGIYDLRRELIAEGLAGQVDCHELPNGGVEVRRAG